MQLTLLFAPLQLLAKNFAAMQRLGDPVLKPFLQVSRPSPEQYQHALHANVQLLPLDKLMSAFGNSALRTSHSNMCTLQLGCRVLMCTLQDVVQFGPMARTLFGQVLADPGFVPQIFRHVGIPPMLDWVRHFSALGTYTLLDKVREQQPCEPCTQAMPAMQRAPACVYKRALSGALMPHGRAWTSRSALWRRRFCWKGLRHLCYRAPVLLN